MHYGILLGIVLLGGVLRFWNLGEKSLWLDEVLTIWFSQGHNVADVPVQQWFSLAQLPPLFQPEPTTCAQIALNVSTDSTHPPLFFCAMHHWLRWADPSWEHLAFTVRSLPALLGTVAIAAAYGLGRQMLSPLTGLIAAVLMAVSPFAVYLSQEARHYTLPMLLVILSLWVLCHLQRVIQDRRSQWFHQAVLWLAWVGLGLLGLYVHYFMVLAIAAQAMAMAVWLAWWDRQQRRLSLGAWLGGLGAIAGLVLGYAPWIPMLLSQFNRPETSWLSVTDPDWGDRLGALAQLVMGWILMVVALPVEHQPLPVVILSGVAMLAVFGTVVAYGIRSAIALRHAAAVHPGIGLIVGYTLGVVLEFLIVVYLLQRDITVAPRYHFIYYPSVCLLLAVWVTLGWESSPRLSIAKRFNGRSLLWLLATAGVVSSSLMAAGLVFQKPYYPDRAAETLYQDRDRPLLVMTAYQSLQDMALALSFAIAVHHIATPTVSPLSDPGDRFDQLQFSFISRDRGYNRVWRQLANLPVDVPSPLNLWAIATPGMDAEDFPTELSIPVAYVAESVTCAIAPDEFHKIGHVYQLYRCED